MRTCAKAQAFTLKLVITEDGRKYATLEFTNSREFRGELGDAGRDLKIKMSLEQLQELADLTHVVDEWRRLDVEPSGGGRG